MSCNSCTKGFSLLRQEKGCPGCGFSYCTKCLNNKVFLPKLQSEVKVCAKCKRSPGQKNNENQIIIPPDAYKKLAGIETGPEVSMSVTSSTEPQSVDDQILARLKKLKEDNAAKVTSEMEIAKRLQDIKGAVQQPPSDADLSYRLAKLKGMPVIDSKPSLPVRDLRTEQQQADDLIKQYVEQTQIDTKYKDKFDNLIGDIESRMHKLKGASTPAAEVAGTSDSVRIGSHVPSQGVISEDEEEAVKKIVERIKAETSIEEDVIAPSTQDELPFCEICNEDATLRCLGCRYLFCKRCFLDHKDDDDDDCNRYEPYQPPKGIQY